MDCEDRSLRVHICCDVWGNQLGFLDGLEIRTGLLKSTAQGQGFRTGVMSSACPQFPTPRPYSVITAATLLGNLSYVSDFSCGSWISS